MRHDVFTCDRCGTRTPATHAFEVELPDPDATQRVDLCAACTARVLKYLVHGLGPEPKRLLLDFALKPQEPARG